MFFVCILEIFFFFFVNVIIFARQGNKIFTEGKIVSYISIYKQTYKHINIGNFYKKQLLTQATFAHTWVTVLASISIHILFFLGLFVILFVNLSYWLLIVDLTFDTQLRQTQIQIQTQIVET